MSNNTARALRDLATNLRTKPMPLKDLIPILVKSADALDAATLAERERCLAIVRQYLMLSKFEEIERAIQSGDSHE